MSTHKRVYHPTLDAFQDVPEGDVEDWSKAGWLKTKPKHVDTTGALPAGEFYVASLPVEPAVEDAPKPTATK